MNFEEELKKVDPDVQHIIWQKGFEARVGHNQPSPETLKIIGDLKAENAQQFGLIQSIYETIHSEYGIMAILKEIKDQTCKTNGRVTKLEFWQAGVIALGTIATIAIPSIGWYYINRFDKLETSVTVHHAQYNLNK